MSTVNAKTLNEVIKAGMNAPGYWQFLFDEPEQVYNDANDPPTHRPNGHWQWIPSAQELYLEQMLAPTASRLLDRKRGQEVSSKGFQIPQALMKRSDPE
jgi:hypothetical protein